MKKHNNHTNKEIINKKLTYKVLCTDNNFIDLIINIIFNKDHLIYFNKKENINFRIKEIIYHDHNYDEVCFKHSKIFKNFDFKKINQSPHIFNFRLNKKELTNIKFIIFGLCEENVKWHGDYFFKLDIEPNHLDLDHSVNYLYKNILNRNVDQNGLDFFKEKLIKKEINLSNLKKILIDSEENKKNIEECGITFLSRIDEKDSLLRIPLMYSFFGNKYFKSNIYDFNIGKININEFAMQKDISSKLNKKIYKNIICCDFTIDFNNYNAENKIRYSMYEADDLPKEWVEKFKRENLKKIIVPDDWCKNIYLKYFENVCVAPLGTFKRDITVKDNEIFRFGYIARFELRKNHKLLINSFLSLFGDNKYYELKIHGIPGHNYEEIKNMCLPYKNIKITSNILSDSELDLWWDNINCYVMPSSGEGFSHTPREALMRGIPTIISNYSSHETLVKLGVVRYFSPSGLEDAFKAVLFNRAVGQHAMFSSLDLQNEMEYVISNYNEAKEQALIGRRYLLENETWEICSKKLLDAVNE